MDELGDPSLEVMDGVIGGPVHAAVAGPGGQQVMTSVTWTVTGAMESQTYQNSVGETTPLSGSVTHWWGNNPVAIDTFSPYWNATVGQHTVSVSVTYTDGSTGNASITVNVTQPTVNAFNISVAPAVLATYNGEVGGQVTLKPPGIQYTATVTVAPNQQGGEFGILQKVFDNITINNNVPHVYNTGLVLDDQGTTGNFFLVQQQSFDVASGSTVSTPGMNAFPPPPEDNVPLFHYWQTPNSGPCTGYSGQIKFQDFLVFCASGGIWVELSQSQGYSLRGSTTWNAGTGQFDGTALIDTSGPTTTPTLGFVSWTGSASGGSYNPPYN